MRRIGGGAGMLACPLVCCCSHAAQVLLDTDAELVALVVEQFAVDQMPMSAVGRVALAVGVREQGGFGLDAVRSCGRLSPTVWSSWSG
ncbi:hypothetical protein [Actinokineospora pegani]|uniref:hypothetical protein n=1 Tax=Actinokineospora pegani TaxID=2654637 RepID=UPI0012EAD5EC|nr:hypothetical protein [Actinokineospora pegani]